MDLGTKPTAMSSKDSDKLDRKARSTIHLCLIDSVFLNVFGEDLVKKLWEKLGNLYQSKSPVNKLFLQKMEEEDNCITLLLSLPNSWDNLVVAIGNSRKSALKFEDIVASLL